MKIYLRTENYDGRLEALETLNDAMNALRNVKDAEEALMEYGGDWEEELLVEASFALDDAFNALDDVIEAGSAEVQLSGGLDLFDLLNKANDFMENSTIRDAVNWIKEVLTDCIRNGDNYWVF